MLQTTAEAASAMKVMVPIAVRAIILNPSSLHCLSCSTIFCPTNGSVGCCSLSAAGGKGWGKQHTQFRKCLGFCRAMSSFPGMLEGREGAAAMRRGLIPVRDEICRMEIVCSQSYGGRGEIGTSLGWQQKPGRESIPGGARKLWIATPLQMGRRSAKIATKKGAQDKKKAKLYGRIGKQIVAAVKDAGPNPVSNPALAALLQTAKDYNIPKDIMDRNIKKASDKNQQDFEELTYEVYGFGGVGIVLEVLTDNNNRAAANIRDVVKKSGGKMAERGSVLFNFKRAGVVIVKASTGTTGDDILLAAMDSGAEDVIEPSVEEEDDGDDEGGDKYYKVLTPVDQFWTVSQKLKEAGIPVDTDNSGLELFPTAIVKPDDEAEELNRLLIEKLLDLDDVDAVSSTQG